MTNPHHVTYTHARRPEEGGYSGFAPSVRTENALVIEQDVMIMLRDGTRIFTDVYRPQAGAREGSTMRTCACPSSTTCRSRALALKQATESRRHARRSSGSAAGRTGRSANLPFGAG